MHSTMENIDRMTGFQNSESFASSLDAGDALTSFRSEFLIPKHRGKDVIYFTGNSLGLQPKAAAGAIQQELKDWADFGVEGHFKSKHPWFSYHEMFKPLLAGIVGAQPSEVTAMGSLTANLHFLMVSFYRPEGRRYKILCESRAFPSDQYALETQVRFHGFDPSDAIIELMPREGEDSLRDEDILETISRNAGSLALIMIGGVNYYTGQLFNMKDITRAGHDAGAVVGFDLAHAAGNALLNLHDWNVDFAAWCSYKYLNSGPGSVAGIFVHDRHSDNRSLPRFAGWWGNDAGGRFKMEKGFIPSHGADSWQVSNAPVFTMAIHKTSLDIFSRATMPALSARSKKMSAFLRFVIKDACSVNTSLDLRIITPDAENSCAAQISLLTGQKGRKLFDFLTGEGVVIDWREPNVIRMAPVPLYNSFNDIWRFGKLLKEAN